MCARALGARGPQGVKPQSLTTNAGKFLKKMELLLWIRIKGVLFIRVVETESSVEFSMTSFFHAGCCYEHFKGSARD